MAAKTALFWCSLLYLQGFPLTYVTTTPGGGILGILSGGGDSGSGTDNSGSGGDGLLGGLANLLNGKGSRCWASVAIPVKKAAVCWDWAKCWPIDTVESSTSITDSPSWTSARAPSLWASIWVSGKFDNAPVFSAFSFIIFHFPGVNDDLLVNGVANEASSAAVNAVMNLLPALSVELKARIQFSVYCRW